MAAGCARGTGPHRDRPCRSRRFARTSTRVHVRRQLLVRRLALRVRATVGRCPVCAGWLVGVEVGLERLPDDIESVASDEPGPFVFDFCPAPLALFEFRGAFVGEEKHPGTAVAGMRDTSHDAGMFEEGDDFGCRLFGDAEASREFDRRDVVAADQVPRREPVDHGHRGGGFARPLDSEPVDDCLRRAHDEHDEFVVQALVCSRGTGRLSRAAGDSHTSIIVRQPYSQDS